MAKPEVGLAELTAKSRSTLKMKKKRSAPKVGQDKLTVKSRPTPKGKMAKPEVGLAELTAKSRSTRNGGESLLEMTRLISENPLIDLPIIG